MVSSGICFRRRPILLSLIFIATTSIAFLVTCSDDSGTKPDQNTMSVQLVGHSDCKSDAKAAQAQSASACSSDCLQYRLDSTGTMHITHLNAALNCCMESLSVSATVVGEVLLISETVLEPSGGLCKCLCLYDVEYEITDIPSGIRKLEVVEPVAAAGEETPLCCAVSFVVPDSGECCVERCCYPWAHDASPYLELTGRTVLSVPIVPAETLMLDSMRNECAEWSWSDAQTLTLTHLFAHFECCLDSLTASMEIRSDTIIITERGYVEGFGCVGCACYDNIEYRLVNLEPGTYFIRFVRPSLTHPTLEGTVQLLTDGKYCAARNY